MDFRPAQSPVPAPPPLPPWWQEIPGSGVIATLESPSVVRSDTDRFVTSEAKSTGARADTVPAVRRDSAKSSDSTATSIGRQGLFSRDLLAFRISEGPCLAPWVTEQVLQALRGTVLSCFESHHKLPQWISGHQSNGCQTREVHLATVPLIGRDAATGDSSPEILGVALALPRDVPPIERLHLFARLSKRMEADGGLTLRLGRLGRVRLSGPIELEGFADRTIASLVATAGEWASVTPVVLHRFPKCKPAGSPDWQAEVRSMIRDACRHADVPDPVTVRCDLVSFVAGLPPAARAPEAYPLLKPRSAGAPKPQLHVRLTFAEPVAGPLVLGLGKYRGFGLCVSSEG
ncbi:MAG TPA: type I-U CRISPR-associated protein Cas5/Cas6 [Planctomycetaceae bacterium]|nr:type I-U CRISPR-associated protein Cas5/Cas6 [Planctomycetaceae bacterium]HRF00485.1 type I-U CRISPR-associated protein Csb2 [Pirellulaceae bacterium]